MSSGNPQSIAVISRRELLKRGGKGAAAAAVSSVFLPFAFTGKAAAPKTLSFWQFYAPAKQAGTQSKWFEDCVRGWNATHDVKVELQFVPVQDYIGGSKLQTVVIQKHPLAAATPFGIGGTLSPLLLSGLESCGTCPAADRPVPRRLSPTGERRNPAFGGYGTRPFRHYCENLLLSIWACA